MLIRQEFSARLHELLDRYEFPKKGRQYRVAKMFNVSTETSRKWLNGEAIPKREAIIAIAQEFPCRPEWLEYGSGPMMQDPLMERVSEIFAEASPEKRQFYLDLLELQSRH